MAVNLENASLLLNTREATTQNSRCLSTWSNINLRSVLGDMWDKYETFNLCLNIITTEASLVDAQTTDENDRNLLVYISGLPWKNQTYNVKTGILSNQTILASFRVPASSTITTNTTLFQSFSLCTFTKGSDVANIAIELKRIDGTIPQSTNLYPHQVYIFDIYGVEPKTKLIDHRIKNL